MRAVKAPRVMYYDYYYRSYRTYYDYYRHTLHHIPLHVKLSRTTYESHHDKS
jgi:hypothetical protein